MDTTDPRAISAANSLGYATSNELSQGDYERLEDTLITTASDIIQTSDELTQLRQAGFNELADKLESLNMDMSHYDWARENL